MPFLTPILTGLALRQWSVLGDIDGKMDGDQSARNHRYAFNTSFLENRVYHLAANGGFREQIFKEAFGLDCTPDGLKLVGAYNPITAIVAAYQNVFRGVFGKELKVDDEVNGQPVNALLNDEKNSPVAKLWRWSNLDTEKEQLQTWAANLGTVGIRVVAQNDEAPEKRRVFLQFDHPAAIYDFEQDDRGNVTEIELRYEDWQGPLSKREKVRVREIITKDKFRKEIDGRSVLEPDQKKNELGVCPYVILRHRAQGSGFGRWAYSGSEDIIHWINWLITNQGESVMEHNWPNWFAAAGGNAPVEISIGKRKVAYCKTTPDTPPPIFQPLVADLDQEGTLKFWNELVDRLHERQPELATVAMKVLSGQSGETIAKLQQPAESAIKKARAQYEHAVIRALQIGLSEGIRMSLWELGTGMGSAEAADKAYQSGKEDFAFTERTALPMTPFDQITQADANVAEDKAKATMAGLFQKLGLPDIEVFKKAGYTEAEAKELVEAASQEFEQEQAIIQDFMPPAKANGNGRPAAAARR